MTAVLLAIGLATAPQTPAAEPKAPEAPRAAVEQVPDYQLGPGDVLSIHVAGVTQFDQSARVSNSGRVRVPYVGVIYVAGQTALQVQEEIATLIKNHGLVVEPSVRVQVETYRAQPTYVIGEVNTPGQFVIGGEMYLLDLIAKAGGLLPTADTTALLYRRRPARPMVKARLISTAERTGAVGSGVDSAATTHPMSEPAESRDEEVVRIDLERLAEGTHPELNLKLRGGDVLHIPRRRQENFYVIGDVQVPGAYTMPRNMTLTAAQAVIYAGGTLPTAKSGKGFLMRHDPNGDRMAIPVDFRGIIDGKSPDVPIQADDIIFIPNSAVRTIGVGLLNMLPTIVQQWLIF